MPRALDADRCDLPGEKSHHVLSCLDTALLSTARESYDHQE
jgi:hypothetical protein